MRSYNFHRRPIRRDSEMASELVQADDEDRLFTEVELRDVSFNYPGVERPTCRRCWDRKGSSAGFVSKQGRENQP